MSEHIRTHKHQTHKHQTHNHAASGWRIRCGVQVTELSTNKQHSLRILTPREGRASSLLSSLSLLPSLFMSMSFSTAGCQRAVLLTGRWCALPSSSPTIIFVSPSQIGISRTSLLWVPFQRYKQSSCRNVLPQDAHPSVRFARFALPILSQYTAHLVRGR